MKDFSRRTAAAGGRKPLSKGILPFQFRLKFKKFTYFCESLNV